MTGSLSELELPTFDALNDSDLLDPAHQRRCIIRNISPSLGLSDHFPGCGILNYRSDRDGSLRGCYFGGAL